MGTTEIRWHGRGGHGIKTAAYVVGKILANTGFYFQAFPEYGAERQGAPIEAFVRISERPILARYGIYEPDCLLIADTGLLFSDHRDKILSGLRESGFIVLNTDNPENLNLNKKYRIYYLDASQIAWSCVNRDVPGTPMAAALFRMLGILRKEELEEVSAAALEELKDKGKKGEKYVKGNLDAIARGFDEVSAWG